MQLLPLPCACAHLGSLAPATASAVPAACLLSVSQLTCPSLHQLLKLAATPSPAQQAYQLRRQQRRAGGAPTHLKKLSGEHLPAITEEATQGSKKPLDTPTALPVSPFADTPAVAAAATEAGHGPEAAQVLSATGTAGTAGTLPPGLSGMLGTHGSLAIAPATSGLGSQRLMSVRLTANSGLIYNTAPIPTVLPAEGAWHAGQGHCCSLHWVVISSLGRIVFLVCCPGCLILAPPAADWKPTGRLARHAGDLHLTASGRRPRQASLLVFGVAAALAAALTAEACTLVPAGTTPCPLHACAARWAALPMRWGATRCTRPTPASATRRCR